MSCYDRGLNFVIQAQYYSLHIQATVHTDCFVPNVYGGFSECGNLLYDMGCQSAVNYEFSKFCTRFYFLISIES